MEMIVDSFAGGGGASLGISWAVGREPDIAINHDAAAITMHAANHPETKHYTEDVWKVDPRSVTGGRPVGLLWASPDCKHFSRAKGAKPVEKKIRSLAWVVVKWASEVKPKMIFLENVREFEDWGPLVPRWACGECDWKGTEGQAKLLRRRRACPRCDSRSLKQTVEMVPDPDRKGLTFRRWKGRLTGLGYKVETKVLNAADYGAPTHRRRLFLIARRDGQPIVWPAATHGDPKKIGQDLFNGHLKPWRTAAECIDWTRPCPSIFDRKRPLAEATMRRIALGIKRYVLENPQPFIVGVGGRMGQSQPAGVDQPNNTVTSKNDRGVVTPYLAKIGQYGSNGKMANSVEDPLTTIVSKNEHLLIAPHLTPLTHQGERKGTSPDEPLPTITAAHRGEQALISPILIGAGGPERAGKPRSPDVPGNTILPKNSTALIAAFLAKHYGGVVGVPADTPLPTTTERGTQNQLVAANLVHMNHGAKQWSAADEPYRTFTTGRHAALVYSFLTKYFGTGCGQLIDDPLHTVTTKDRFGLVTVTVDGEPYVIVDIGMRMLTPRELARGQGFPDSYVLTGNATSQVARIGNSVCPIMAEALVRANYSAIQQREAA